MPGLENEVVRTESIITQIVDKVESLTRYDRSNISVINADPKTVDVPMVCELRYVVSFNRVGHSGYGSLPGGAISAPNKTALDSHIQMIRASAEQGLPNLLARWVADHAVPPEPPLVANDCYQEKPLAGYVYTCGNCGGSGRVTCGSCGGSGTLKKQREKVRYVQRTRWDAGTNSNITEFVNEYYTEDYTETCFSCSSGKVNCPSCGGGGTCTCSSCNGAGKRHELAGLKCAVSSAFTISAHTAIAEAQEKLQALPGVPALALLAPVKRTQAKVEGNRLVNVYTATVQVTRIQVVAVERQFEILGYGNSARVENFKNIIGIMLENDLSELEKSLQKAPWIALRPNPDLDAALGNVLKSEIHSHIVTEGSQPVKDLKVLAQQEFAHLVSEKYATRAVQTIKNALVCLYRAHGLAAMALALGTTLALCVVVHLLRLIEHQRLIAYAASFCAGLLAGSGYSSRGLSLIRTRYSEPLGEKVTTLLRVTGSVRNWRKLGAGVSLFATVLMVYGTGGFWLDARQRGYNEVKAKLRQESEQRVKDAKEAVGKAKPATRRYLLACLQNDASRAKMAANMPSTYGSIIMKPWPEVMKLFGNLKSSPDMVKRYAQNGDIQYAMILSCKSGNIPAGGYNQKEWEWRVFKPLYYEGTTSDSAKHNVSYLNLLNTDSESGEESMAETQRLGELMPLFLEQIGNLSAQKPAASANKSLPAKSITNSN